MLPQRLNEDKRFLDPKVWASTGHSRPYTHAGVSVLEAGTVYIQRLAGSNKRDVRNVAWIQKGFQGEKLADVIKADPMGVQRWLSENKIAGFAEDGAGTRGTPESGYLLILDSARFFRRIQNVPGMSTLPEDHGINPTSKEVPKGGLIFNPAYGYKRLQKADKPNRELYNTVASVLYPTLVMNEPRIKQWVTTNPAPTGPAATDQAIVVWYSKLMHEMLADNWVFLEHGRVWCSDQYTAQHLLSRLPRSAVAYLADNGWKPGVAVTLFNGRNRDSAVTMDWWHLTHRTDAFTKVGIDVTNNINATLLRNESDQERAEEQAFKDLARR